MKARSILFTIFILIVTVLPALHRRTVLNIFKAELENISGVNAVVRNDGGFLAILKEGSKKQAVSVASKINKLRKKKCRHM